MVVRGKIRGNGSQLASYLSKKGDNDNVRLFEIKGTGHERDLRHSLLEMSLTSELTKTDKGLFHVQICPAYGDDRSMTDDDWKRAADIMEQETGFVGQKRVIVLHCKKSKYHAHVIWERYDHDKGVMKPNKFSRLAQDRARLIMEKEFEHTITPERNQQRPEMKEYLSAVWRKTEDADSFMNAIAEKKYFVAAGTQRPYMVVDETGRSFNLVRQLEGIRIGEVRERFKNVKLAKEKKLIEQARDRQAADKLKEKAATAARREILKSQAVENAQQITVSLKPKLADKTFVMNMNYEIPSEAYQQSPEQLKAVLERADEKQKKKQEILDKLRQDRLEKARQFRENERDL